MKSKNYMNWKTYLGTVIFIILLFLLLQFFPTFISSLALICVILFFYLSLKLENKNELNLKFIWIVLLIFIPLNILDAYTSFIAVNTSGIDVETNKVVAPILNYFVSHSFIGLILLSIMMTCFFVLMLSIFYKKVGRNVTILFAFAMIVGKTIAVVNNYLYLRYMGV